MEESSRPTKKRKLTVGHDPQKISSAVAKTKCPSMKTKKKRKKGGTNLELLRNLQEKKSKEAKVKGEKGSTSKKCKKKGEKKKRSKKKNVHLTVNVYDARDLDDEKKAKRKKRREEDKARRKISKGNSMKSLNHNSKKIAMFDPNEKKKFVKRETVEDIIAGSGVQRGIGIRGAKPTKVTKAELEINAPDDPSLHNLPEIDKLKLNVGSNEGPITLPLLPLAKPPLSRVKLEHARRLKSPEQSNPKPAKTVADLFEHPPKGNEVSPLMLFQLPPIMPLQNTEVKKGREILSKMPEDNDLKKSSFQNGPNSISMLDPGLIGRLVVYKSGKVRLKFKDNGFSLDVNKAIPTAIHEDLMSIRCWNEDDMSLVGELTNLGTLLPDRKLSCAFNLNSIL